MNLSKCIFVLFLEHKCAENTGGANEKVCIVLLYISNTLYSKIYSQSFFTTITNTSEGIINSLDGMLDTMLG